MKRGGAGNKRITNLKQSQQQWEGGIRISIVTCRRVGVTIMTGSSLDDWIYWHFGYTLS
jgi:hypothetical protein